jgi:hypothetical protein
MSEKQKFPTEVVDLPSKGLVYPKDHPLADGTIEMKYMTAREEDILTSSNLIQKGIVIDELLKSLIITKVDFNDVIVGDKNAIMLAARVLGYGKKYEVEVTCPSCNAKEEVDFDLTSFPHKKIDEDLINSENKYEFTLPNADRKIEFRFLTHKDENAIESELKRLGKVSNGITPEITTRLRYQIISVDGDDDKEYVNKFIKNEFFAIDSKSFRDYYSKIVPDVNFDSGFLCAICDWSGEVDLPITTNFFWPSR